MIEAPDRERECPPATDGEIAVLNLESARRRAWSRFAQDPPRAGIAEAIVEYEQTAAQFLGDAGALDRLETLAAQLAGIDALSGQTALIEAHVASMAHRFADARRHLAHAELRGAPSAAVHRLSLSVDQACGEHPDAVLEARRRAAASGRLEDLVPLGALLADLREFDEADRVYRQALRGYTDVSPFALAWVCFQLGVLWGELVPDPDMNRAEDWYRRAVEYLPRYVKARVHLAEICASRGGTGDAEALLVPALSSGDPEVRWRLADVLTAQGRFDQAQAQLDAARSGFEDLLGRHPLAFADHGAEFFSGSGNDRRRALELARANVANRPTLGAFDQAYAIALGAGDATAASEMRAAARERWGGTAIFRSSALAQPCIDPANNVGAAA